MKLAILIAIVLLSGCSTLDKQFANRIAFTADGKAAFIASMYGPIGIASKVYADDAKAMIEASKK